MRFRIDCVPPTVTAQHKGVFVVNGKPRFFTKAKNRQAENLLASLLAAHRPSTPFSTPVSVELTWTFPWRKSERRRVVAAGMPVPHTSRPDLDNLEKSLLDVLTRLLFWQDDSLVAEKHTAKFWGPNPGIEIAIESIAANREGDAT